MSKNYQIMKADSPSGRFKSGEYFSKKIDAILAVAELKKQFLKARFYIRKVK